MTKIKSVVLHDETINTHGFRMLTSGGDLSEFIKNPVMLLNHDDWSLPIGRWENIRKEGTEILADPVFDLKDDRGKVVAQKIEDGFLRAASIGAWPPTETSTEPQHMLPGQKHPTVTKWKAREASFTTIGANHNALVFYDAKGEKIDLTDPAQVLKLFDIKNQFKTENKMSVLNAILKLSDTATEQDRIKAINDVLELNVQLKDANAKLQQKITDQEEADKAARKAEAIVLTDAAVLDGRINAPAKEQWIKMFDGDFDTTKTILEGLPKRKSVKEMIDQQNREGQTNLSDLQKASWDELDKSGKLVNLRDNHPDLYKEKYKAKFGVEPKE